MPDFGEKVAFVTGAGSGIGVASARAFATAGARVAAVDINGSEAEKAAAALRAEGHEAIALEVDVGDWEAVGEAVRATVNHFGRLDFAHNNAGIGGGFAPLAAYPRETWHRVLATNLTGVFNCLQHEIAFMAEHDGGAIVNTSSAAGVWGMPGTAGYVASKHGVCGLTKVAALEYAERGVRVNAVLPGKVDTPFGGGLPDDRVALVIGQHPAKRMGEADEIAAAAVWLCSDAASFVHGALLPVDGGYTVGATAKPSGG